MRWLAQEVFWIVAISALAYLTFDLVVTFLATRAVPKEPATGLEALLGRHARVLSTFEPSPSDGRCYGRVMVRAENWIARWDGAPDALPAPGSMVEIIAIESDPVCMIVR